MSIQQFKDFYNKSILPEIKKDPSFKRDDLLNIDNFFTIDMNMEKLLYAVNNGKVTSLDLLSIAYIYDPSRYKGPEPVQANLVEVAKAIFGEDVVEINNDFKTPFLFMKYPGLSTYKSIGFFDEYEVAQKIGYESIDKAAKDLCIFVFNMSYGCTIGNTIIRYNVNSKIQSNKVITEDMIYASKPITISNISNINDDVVFYGSMKSKKVVILIKYDMVDTKQYSLCATNSGIFIHDIDPEMLLTWLRVSKVDTVLKSKFDKWFTHLKFINYLSSKGEKLIRPLSLDEIDEQLDKSNRNFEKIIYMLNKMFSEIVNSNKFNMDKELYKFKPSFLPDQIFDVIIRDSLYEIARLHKVILDGAKINPSEIEKDGLKRYENSPEAFNTISLINYAPFSEIKGYKELVDKVNSLIGFFQNPIDMV